ncbi:MAG: T9SS type A sorting domain-containing protein [Bacteroidota bacterium]
MKRVLLYILLILTVAGLQAQPLTLAYEVLPAAQGVSMDTISISLRNNTGSAMDLSAVNFSLATQSSCATLSVDNSNFNTTWGSTMEFSSNQSISLDYEYIIYVNGVAKPSGMISYDNRWQHGNTNAADPNPTAVSLAAGTNGVEVMRVLVDLQATCSNEVYLESITENPANEIADMAGNLVDYVIERVDDVLPVEWLDFTAYQTGESSVTLDWSTLTESNNASFDIEKSLDGILFERIGSIQGQGTTSNISTYSHIDEKVYEPTNFYRIKQIDFNGDFSYSNIQEVRMGAGFSYHVELYPNPAIEEISISATADGIKTFEMELVDMTGRILQSQNQLELGGSQVAKVNISTYTPGIYMIRLREQNDESFYTQTFIKK